MSTKVFRVSFSFSNTGIKPHAESNVLYVTNQGQAIIVKNDRTSNRSYRHLLPSDKKVFHTKMFGEISEMLNLIQNVDFGAVWIHTALFESSHEPHSSAVSFRYSQQISFSPDLFANKLVLTGNTGGTYSRTLESHVRVDPAATSGIIPTDSVQTILDGLDDVFNDFFCSVVGRTTPQDFFSNRIIDLKMSEGIQAKAKSGILPGVPTGAPWSKNTSSSKTDAPKQPVRFVTEGGEKFIRPNGEEYRPRDLSGHTDVAFLRATRKANIPVRLEGPPGAGKTALVEAAHPDCITINGHGDLTVSHFVGTYRPATINNETVWIWEDGPLTRAMKEGRTLFVDEGTRPPTEVMNVLFSAMDGRNMLRIDDRPDEPIVKAVEGFYVIMGYNPLTLGARALDEALVSRFRMMVQVNTDFNTARALGVPAKAVKVARKMETYDKESQRAGGVGVWIPQMRELLTVRDLINAGAGEEIAFMNLLASCPDEDSADILSNAILQTLGHSVTAPTLGGAV